MQEKGDFFFLVKFNFFAVRISFSSILMSYVASCQKEIFFFFFNINRDDI